MRLISTFDPVRVELLRATLPPPIGWIAVHHWFVVCDDSGRTSRWEVWQNKNAGGTSWAHVHRDLKAPYSGVGGGKAVRVKRWEGKKAERLAAALADSESYPHRHRYRPWPGPNSNTYVRWILRRTGLRCRLGLKAWGQDFPCPCS
ncbi:MAG: DUF3750 domain-containing protein [Verrucomicrobiae bacterium]|nr:DUF3750 domain-containing protein [Verrucomicrobiae bacterium]